MMVNFLKNAEQVITDRKILKKLDISKKNMLRLLVGIKWKTGFGKLADDRNFSAEALLNILKPAMSYFSTEPDCGWLQHISDSVRAYMYPENFKVDENKEMKKAKLFFMENYRLLLSCEKKLKGFSPVNHIELLSDDETEQCITSEEYDNLKKFWKDNYIFEFMRLNREISPFNTAGHTGGVHFVAVYMGKQLSRTDIPVDMALLSGAAVCHDIGKFGCSPNEAKRIPYLHYYYTDELLKREKMPMTAHIASNHSTWDLELENLSVESLLLIYADFRVKSEYTKNGEIVRFYTLDEAFDVILDKLDNVDEVKRQRYNRVYAKLKDFENYMLSLGIETDVFGESGKAAARSKKDTALMMGEEVVEGLKYTAIEHNIKLMSIFNNEAAFGSLLESARSERQWKSQRAYLNILTEYYTYMTKHEKLFTIHFLYELLSHREGDIRRQAGKLLGTIIANYDDIYRKEIPECVENISQNEALDIWKTYLYKIIFPDYRVTDQHRSWIGYTLKMVIQGLLENMDKDTGRTFMRKYFDLFRKEGIKNSGVFVMLDSLITVPVNIFSSEDMIDVLNFAARVSVRDSVEIKIGALRVSEYIADNFVNEKTEELINIILNRCEEVSENISVSFLAYKICLSMNDKKNAEKYYSRFTNYKQADEGDENAISIMFRENLKVGTPWVVKIVNIEFLMHQGIAGNLNNQKFHLATHLSNLIKVSERVTVRHKAGRCLIEIAKTLPIEQLNEIVIELTKGLEIGEYQFSKYIPEYLGKLALLLHPSELDEFIGTLGELIESTNDRIGSVALDTVGELLKRYTSYSYKNYEKQSAYKERKTRMLGMLLKGFVNYQEVVSQEAFLVIGQYIFGNESLTKEEKFDSFKHLYKKILTLIKTNRDYDMNFFTNAAALNHIYRFISEYKFSCGSMNLSDNRGVAFFPGTFDPFSLSHKGIVQAIRDEGFTVYLALDEFSWSKNTQPRMIRRQIVNMSVADEQDVYMFPDDFPVNIANPEDLKNLKKLFPGKELYIVVGSDVITNASSYKTAETENSIHSMNHIVFRRETMTDGQGDRELLDKVYKGMSGKIRELKLPVHLEDISSTRIRENIDLGRDIANLIDSVAQNFIYDNSLYLREPQYKSVFETKGISFEPLSRRGSMILDDIGHDMRSRGINVGAVKEYIDGGDVRTAVIKDEKNRVCTIASVNELETSSLYEAFHDIEIAAYLRQKTTGRMLVIRELYCSNRTEMMNMIRIIMTEVLSEAAAKDITYAIYYPLEREIDNKIKEVIVRQGFTEINIEGKPQGIYEVNMKEPIAVIENMDTVLKAPFNTNPKILDILEKTHGDMQLALTKLNPGNLVISFNAGVMHRKIVNMVTKTNNVPNYTLEQRQLGEYMCVPFGKIMRGMAVPNTVTKALHTEKMFTPKLDSFTIEEYPMYSTIANQIKTIKSFNRPVILVDDLLHKGYRIKALDPLFKENGLEVRKIITGLLSGQGKDLMTIQGREVESAYFLPNLKAWFVESTLCPFIGGDGVQSENDTEYNLINSINLILPFAAPRFLKDAPREAIYDMSAVCIENASKIFSVLEEEYQKVFERQLTIKHLSDAIISPRMPNGTARVFVDVNLSPSVYMADYMERLVRLESVLK